MLRLAWVVNGYIQWLTTVYQLVIVLHHPRICFGMNEDEQRNHVLTVIVVVDHLDVSSGPSSVFVRRPPPRPLPLYLPRGLCHRQIITKSIHIHSPSDLANPQQSYSASSPLPDWSISPVGSFPPPADSMRCSVSRKPASLRIQLGQGYPHRSRNAQYVIQRELTMVCRL